MAGLVLHDAAEDHFDTLLKLTLESNTQGSTPVFILKRGLRSDS